LLAELEKPRFEKFLGFYVSRF